MAKNWYHKARKETGASYLTMAMARKAADEAARKYEKEAQEKAMHRAMGISLSVLAADFWPKTVKRKAPKFVKEFVSAYESVLRGIMTDEEIAAFLEDTAGLEIKASWLSGKYHSEED